MADCTGTEVRVESPTEAQPQTLAEALEALRVAEATAEAAYPEFAEAERAWFDLKETGDAASIEAAAALSEEANARWTALDDMARNVADKILEVPAPTVATLLANLNAYVEWFSLRIAPKAPPSVHELADVDLAYALETAMEALKSFSEPTKAPQPPLVGALSELIAAHDAAVAGSDAINKSHRIDVLGREPTAEENAVGETAAAAGYDAWKRILEYRPLDVADLARWSAWVSERADEWDLDEVALRAVNEAIKAVASPTASPLAYHLDEYRRLWAENNAKLDAATGPEDDVDDPVLLAAAEAHFKVISGAPVRSFQDALVKFDMALERILECEVEIAENPPADWAKAMAVEAYRFLRDGAPAAQPTAWAKAYAVYEQARAAERAIDAEVEAARELVEAEAPCPPELELQDDRRYVVESSIIDDKKLSFDEKAALVATHREWQIRRNAAKERHELEALKERSEEANYVSVEAQDALWEVSPSSIAELAVMFRIFMEERFLDCQPEAFVSRFAEELTGDKDYDRSLVARLYQNVVRLTGADDPVLAIGPFDAKAWIIAFERHPGHHVWSGHATYTEPHAFGPNGLCLADFRVEGEALERYADEHWKQLQPEYYAEWLSRGKRPIQAIGREQVAEIWAHDPEEQERRVAMWDRYKSQQPTGKHLADRLETWQKKLVAKEGRERDLEVEALAPGHQSASDFVRAYEECGGTIQLKDDSLWLGAPVGEGLDDALFMLAPLRRRLEDNASYKAEVISYLRHRPPAAIDTGSAGLIEPRAEVGMGGQ